MIKKLLLTSAISALVISTAQASAIYPVGAKTGFLLGGQFGINTAIANITGMNAQFNLGYDYAFSRMFSLGGESGVGVMPYFGSNTRIFAYTLPILITGKLVFHDGINLMLKAGATQTMTTDNIDSGKSYSIAPTFAFGVGYKPANSWNIKLTYTEILGMSVINTTKNVGSLSLGFTYTFGANPIDQTELLVAQYNVHNGIPWYR